MATNPSRFDVIVTDNLFGDIITDLAAAVSGGIGLAASGNINADRTGPSMFEPIHGSAPDIAGKGLADPSATVLSVAMMLDFLGHSEIAKRVEDAVAADAASRVSTTKGGAVSINARRSTSEIGDAIAARIGANSSGACT
jgi:3-isopropylmalate dehydrogenase